MIAATLILPMLFNVAQIVADNSKAFVPPANPRLEWWYTNDEPSVVFMVQQTHLITNSFRYPIYAEADTNQTTIIGWGTNTFTSWNGQWDTIGIETNRPLDHYDWDRHHVWPIKMNREMALYRVRATNTVTGKVSL